MPVVLVDGAGYLVYFNPAVEGLLGFSEDDFEEIPLASFLELGDPREADNAPLPVSRMPITVALHERRPQQSTLIVHGRDGAPHRIVTTAIPLDGQGGVLLGAMSIFWEEDGFEPSGGGPPTGAAPIEIILLKQVAGYLATPVFLVDEDGALEYYNEPAEALLGRRYEETGRIPLETWGRLWPARDADGRPLDHGELPLAIAVRDRRPVQGTVWVRGSDGHDRELIVTALPLEGSDGAQLGAFAIFWESGG